MRTERLAKLTTELRKATAEARSDLARAIGGVSELVDELQSRRAGAVNAILKSDHPAIDDRERAARQKAIDSARASIELEGFTLSHEVEAISRRYIAGELTGDEHVAAIRAAVLGG